MAIRDGWFSEGVYKTEELPKVQMMNMVVQTTKIVEFFGKISHDYLQLQNVINVQTEIIDWVFTKQVFSCESNSLRESTPKVHCFKLLYIDSEFNLEKSIANVFDVIVGKPNFWVNPKRRNVVCTNIATCVSSHIFWKSFIERRKKTVQ